MVQVLVHSSKVFLFSLFFPTSFSLMLKHEGSLSFSGMCLLIHDTEYEKKPEEFMLFHRVFLLLKLQVVLAFITFTVKHVSV